MDCEFCTISADNSCKDSCILLFYADELLVKEQDGIILIPSMRDISLLHIETTTVHYSCSLNGTTYYAATLCEKALFAGFSFKKLRQLSGHIADDCFEMTYRAFHIINWLKTNKFCGCCGKVMQVMRQPQEFSVQCPACGHTVYPRISPAIIVAVIKENEILLARSSRFPPGRYSVIAGFVEPGETLETCVRRELQEEVGIEVANIEYFGNQPWPFPDSLMIAFTAQYAGGEITIDNDEIVAADWFSATTLPKIPPKGSIARQLIEWFLDKQS
ncbi:NADH pyrophosphatase [Sporomusa silvacetica DSM 10669]|uniref:NAD(+) diphosphatase n=1 Tax=Sporomusa silvacetica DSM 10669 TaxID=1123289 RepID=A0ABZ3IHS3_9FIRM|nr:NAD(+) diphosphatase [Sporomusa silvacetica]OZC14816.1 NADH pyrophosphatase [Sporomusa silvacetica DSM 10669]